MTQAHPIFLYEFSATEISSYPYHFHHRLRTASDTARNRLTNEYARAPRPHSEV